MRRESLLWPQVYAERQPTGCIATSLTPEENRTAYGKCNNPHGHGHNYTIEVLVGGEVEQATGMVIDLVDLDEAVKTCVIDRFDHTNLNLDPLFASLVPTTENLCRAIYSLLKTGLRVGLLEYVRVEETENNFFQCYDAPVLAEASQALAQAS